MKKAMLISLVLLLANGNLLLEAQSKDPVKKTNKENERKAEAGTINKEVADFLVKSADARMMDLQEGEMAVKTGTTAGIRKYGRLMIKDQTLLLKKINQLAVSRHISLPSGISNNKEDGREDLSEKKGKGFDKTFMKMMELDHKRDVKLFKRATSYQDKGVRLFADKYLPMIQIHLRKIKILKQATE